MSWEPFFFLFFQHSREVLYADCEIQRELKRYIRFQNILSPESAALPLKQLLSHRENALDALSKTGSEIITFLNKDHYPRHELVMARRKEEGRVWNMPPQ